MLSILEMSVLQFEWCGNMGCLDGFVTFELKFCQDPGYFTLVSLGIWISLWLSQQCINSCGVPMIYMSLMRVFKYLRFIEFFKEVEPCELVNVHVFGMDPLFFVGYWCTLHVSWSIGKISLCSYFLKVCVPCGSLALAASMRCQQFELRI